MEPNFQMRPPNVSREWWYSPRTTWHARQQAIRAWHVANRPVDVERARLDSVDMPKSKLVSSAERTAIVEQCFEAGLTAEQIVAEMGAKPYTIVRALERTGRRDLIPDFARIARMKVAA